jgi:NADH-quinone oxidoreductase subunit L
MPLVILAILSIVGGLVGIPSFMMTGGHWFAAYLEPVFHTSYDLADEFKLASEVSHQTEWILTGVSIILILVISGLALKKYRNYKETMVEEKGLGKVLENKWYVDEFYDAIIVRPLKYLSTFFNNVIERSGIDALVNGVGKGINYSSRQVRLLQNGQVGSYILMMVIGAIVLFIIQILAR